MNSLVYDYSFMLSEAIGSAGVSISEIDSLKERILSLRKSQFISSTKILGYMRIPCDVETAKLVNDKSNYYSEKFDTLIVLGIGGSDLGARATITALRHPFANFIKSDKGMRVFFLGGNTDPNEIRNVVDVIDWNNTLINVISKSGDTVETMSTFIYLRDLLIQSVGEKSHSEHIIATTDVSKGTLRLIADKEGYDSLVVPDDVGGRFSVLSAVGLFPIACAGIDITDLLNGAKDFSQSYFLDNNELKSAEIFAGLHFLGYMNKHQNIHVLLPYCAQLRDVGFWFRQLWAESLGKKDSIYKDDVFVGPTPIAALGATDQHSQFQLYYHGPFDKIFTFIQIENFGSILKIPESYSDIEGISYMSGLSFDQILNTELKGSSLALAERGRPNGRIILPELTPYYVGQLFQFFEIATSYMGSLMSINTYDQPAVELGKQNVYALLDRKGFENRKSELSKLMDKYGKKLL